MAPSRNRVTPLGDIEAFPLRGAWTGNRGILHSGREIVRFHASDLWITCALEFRGWWREQWLPNRWTHLFFHDEAVSFAAGHRPCAECRRESYRSYQDAWAAAFGGEQPLAVAIKPTAPRRAHRAGHAPAEVPRGGVVRPARRGVRPARPDSRCRRRWAPGRVDARGIKAAGADPRQARRWSSRHRRRSPRSATATRCRSTTPRVSDLYRSGARTPRRRACVVS